MGASKGKARHCGKALALACLLAISATLPAVHAGWPEATRILFVGNSYIYTNDMPARVRQLARARTLALDTRLRAAPDYALADHLRDHAFLAMLEEPWDWVVLQQGPSSLPENRNGLLASAGLVAARLRGKPTRIALMAAWPAASRTDTSPAAEANYRYVADAIGACVLPVAAAWRLAGEDTTLPVLYAPDRLHPNRIGTRLSAMVVLRGLFGAGSASVGNAKGGERERAMESIVEAAYAQEPRACGSD